jgi:hypothetical protein
MINATKNIPIKANKPDGLNSLTFEIVMFEILSSYVGWVIG